jgi:hypothetical protein
MHLRLQSMIHKWSAISGNREHIARQEHNYGHNSMRIVTYCCFPSLASSARHCPWPSVQVSITKRRLHKAMFLTIFVGLCPWLKSLGSPVYPSLFKRKNPSRSGSELEMNVSKYRKWKPCIRLGIHPGLWSCGMNIHALVLFFLGACPFIHIGCVPNERMECLHKYIQSLAARGSFVEKSHLALL